MYSSHAHWEKIKQEINSNNEHGFEQNQEPYVSKTQDLQLKIIYPHRDQKIGQTEAKEWQGIAPPMLKHKCYGTTKRHAWVHILTLGLLMLHT